MSTSPFDFINAICNKKPEIMEEPQADIQYRKSAFIVNRGLAYFPDTIMQANNMNLNSHIPPDWQFSYLLNSITKSKRYSEWAKKLPASDDLDLVMKYYDYNKRKAMAVLNILTKEQLDIIRKKFEKGGKL